MWFYSLLGEEFGPVSVKSVRELLANGTLTARDNLREAGTSRSVLAEEVAGQANDSHEIATDLDQFTLVDNTAAAPLSADLLTDSETPAANWYCEVLGQTLGPMSFADLEHLVASGQLGPHDKVQEGIDGRWLAASRVSGLYFSKAVFTLARPDQPVVDQDFNHAVSNDSPDQDWFFEIADQVIGPVDFGTLVSLVSTGELGPHDRVRQRSDSRWQAASRTSGLYFDKAMFTTARPVAAEPQTEVFEESAADVLAYEAAPEPEPVGPQYSGPLEWWCRVQNVEHGPMTRDELIDWARDRRIGANDDVRRGNGKWFAAASVSDVANVLFASRPRIAESPANAPEVVAERPAPTVTAPPVPAYAPQAYTPPAALPTPPPPPAWKPTRSTMSSSGNSLFASLRESLNPKILIGLAAAIVVAGIVLAPWSQVFGSSDQEFYSGYVKLLEEFKQLRSGSASEPKWQEFTIRAKPQVDGYVAVLSKTASADNPGRQQLLHAGRDYWPELLSSARSQPNEAEEKFQNCLKEAQTRLNLNR